MDTVYQALAEQIQQGEAAALATIIEVKGSAPREVGARMLIHPLGRHVGTVGGGCGEAETIRAALDVMVTGQPRIVAVDLTEEISLQSSGVCGGIVRIFIERWPREEEAVLSSLLAAIAARVETALITVVATPPPLAHALGRHAVLRPDQPPIGALELGEQEAKILADAQAALAERQHRLLRYQTPTGPLEVFVGVQRRPPHLVIVGAGHVAQPLAQIASLCDFRVTVLDDRPQFAHPARFPTADEVLAAPLRATMRQWMQEGRIDADTYLVLVTRGHEHDVECLLEVLDAPAAYIGMIGSQRRVRAVFQLLSQEQGIAPEKFDRIHAPIGLDIGARTPAEIAVCIMAEIILIYRGRGTGAPLAAKRRAGLSPRPQPAPGAPAT